MHTLLRHLERVGFDDWSAPAPLVELAQTCWLNAKLHDDIVAEREGLPPLTDRARQLRAIVDAYGLPANQRRGLLDRIIEYVISDTADEADDAGVTPDMTSHPAHSGQWPGGPAPPPGCYATAGA